MKIHVFSIPQTRPSLIQWIESHVVGVNLRDLVDELQALHGTQSEDDRPDDLQSICGDHLTEVLSSGLNALTDQQISQVLQNPFTLLELQELAFVEGSEYWAQLASDGTAGRMATSMQADVISCLGPLESRTNPGQSSVTNPELELPLLETVQEPMPVACVAGKTVRAGSQSRWIAAVVTAAAILLLAVTQWPSSSVNDGWGFSRPQLLTANVSEQEFFVSLSGAAQDWFKLDHSTPASLEANLAALSNSCQTLLDAPLPQLSSQSRQWVHGKCRTWKTTVDQHLVALRNDQSRFETTRSEMDVLMKRMVQTLKEGSSLKV